VHVPLPTLEVLERTRRGEAVDPGDISALVDAWMSGAASDAQMASWCATAGFRGVPYAASLAVVRALLGSGDRLELASLGNTVDIRSAGGVGDSALVVVASCIAAASGAIVASIGGRAIAHVGGVLQSVASIPGMRPEMPVAEWVAQARDAGMVIAEAGDRLVPGERRLAALRDSTATAEGDVVVAISAAARGISGGAGTLAVEIPAGPGALLPDLEHAQVACRLVADLGAEWHRTVVARPALRTEPVAGVAGHALEMEAALRVLGGDGDDLLADEAVALAASALGGCGLEADAAAARAVLADGRAASAAERWIAAQGGDAAVVAQPDRIPRAPVRWDVVAQEAGVVRQVDAGVVGAAARWLGAGRLDPGQVIDPTVGVRVVARPGTPVATGDVLAQVEALDDWMAARAQSLLAGAFTLEA
jgi:pyrimidine-nucleoside phosphorylase